MNCKNYDSMEKVYEFWYNDCIYESAAGAVSLHRTKTGAYKAMRKFIINEYTDWHDQRIMYGKYKDGIGEIEKFGIHCAWGVRERLLYE